MPAEALFLEFQDRAAAAMHTPEVFPRADGTTYVCAISQRKPGAGRSRRCGARPGRAERLEAICDRPLAPLRALRRSWRGRPAFRPVTQDGLPLIGPVPGVEGAYVATGHASGDSERAGDGRGDGGADPRRRADQSTSRRSIRGGFGIASAPPIIPTTSS